MRTCLIQPRTVAYPRMYRHCHEVEALVNETLGEALALLRRSAMRDRKRRRIPEHLLRRHMRTPLSHGVPTLAWRSATPSAATESHLPSTARRCTARMRAVMGEAISGAAAGGLGGGPQLRSGLAHRARRVRRARRCHPS